MNANSATPDKTHYGGWLKQLGVAALYALLLYLGELFFESHSVVGYFKPASGLAVAVLLLGGKRYTWGIFFGAALAHAITGDSLREAAIVTSSDTLQAFCGAWLLTRSKFDIRLQSMKDFLLLILLGGAINIFIGGLIMNTVFHFFGLYAHGDYFDSLIEWWMSDTLGVILIAPMILAWWQAKEIWRNKGQVAEALLLLGLTILVGLIVFFDWLHESIAQAPKAYWTFIPIIWVAMRLGVRETTTALLMVAIMGLFGAIHGTGYFAYDVAHNHMLNYWIFMVTLSVVGMALATHIAERKQAEEKLTSILKAVESTSDAIGLADIQGRHVYQNKALAKLFGYATAEELQAAGGPPATIKDPEVAKNMFENIMSGKPWVGELEMMTKSGHVFPAYVRADAIKDDKGNIIGLIGIITDITERKLAESALSESRAFLKTIVDTAPMRIFWKDRELRYLGCNPVFARDAGASSPQDIIGKDDFQLGWKEQAELYRADDRQVMDSCIPKLAYEEPQTTPGGKTIWLRTSKVPLRNAANETIGLLGIYEDITERKQAEQLLRSEQELKAQQAVAQKFSAHLQKVREEEKAAIAREIHDNLGSTLTALKMKIFQLKAGLPANKETKQIHEYISSISQLINDASGIARHIITGLQPTILNDLGLLAAIEWQAEQTQAFSGIECMVNCIGDKGGLDQQRSIALFRILQEALTNVVRHSSASRVEIEFHHSDEEVVMSVIDNGVGITNGHNIDSSHYGSHGMRERAALLGGAINFETPPGGGFGVTVILPLFARKEDES